MQYAVLKLSGRQYRVSPGDLITVDRMDEDKGKELVLEDVLLFVNGDDVKIGDPIVEGVKVKAKVVDNLKGAKLYVRKFKAKSRYRRTIGFRPYITNLEIVEVGGIVVPKKVKKEEVENKSVKKATLKQTVARKSK